MKPHRPAGAIEPLPLRLDVPANSGTIGTEPPLSGSHTAQFSSTLTQHRQNDRQASLLTGDPTPLHRPGIIEGLSGKPPPALNDREARFDSLLSTDGKERSHARRP